MPEGNHLPAISPDEPAKVVSPDELRARILALYGEHGAELRRFVLGVVRDPEVASDVLQATLSKALEQGHTARPETFKGWLFRVAYHEALALRRREQAGDQARQRLARLGTPGSDAGDAESRLIAGETAEAVRKALGTLPEEQRRVVVARIYEDKTFAEIAGESGLPLGTVLTRMRLALARLRETLRPNEPKA